MKQTKQILLTAVLLLCSLVASAQTKVEIDGIWYNLITKGKAAEVTRGENCSGSIDIPATVKHGGVDYSVTSIGNGAFRDCSNLIAITIPESVTRI